MKKLIIIARFVMPAILFLSSFFYVEMLFATRVSINDMVELTSVFKQVTPDSFVIFDVDEVLVYPENIVQLQVAAPFWEASMSELEKRRGKETRDLLHSIML